MTPSLATIEGLTREQARDQYIGAIAALVQYHFRDVALECFARPAYNAYLYANKWAPTPEAMSVVVGFQAREYARLNPPKLKTIELVS